MPAGESARVYVVFFGLSKGSASRILNELEDLATLIGYETVEEDR